MDFGARIYNPSIGRWLTRDPKLSKYPGLTPYNFSANTPLIAFDPDGKDIIIVGSAAYRRYVKKQLAIMSQTKIGRQIVKYLSESSHNVTIREINFGERRSVNRAKHLGKYTLEQLNEPTVLDRSLSPAEVTFFNPAERKGYVGVDVLYFPFEKDGYDIPNDHIGSVNTPSFIGLGHELMHAYIDFTRGNDLGDEARLDKAGIKTKIHEFPAMAYENYLRDIFSVKGRNYYGYRRFLGQYNSQDEKLADDFGVVLGSEIITYLDEITKRPLSGLDNFPVIGEPATVDDNIIDFNVDENGYQIEITPTDPNVRREVIKSLEGIYNKKGG